MTTRVQIVVLVVTACGGSSPPSSNATNANAKGNAAASGDPESVFGPLEIGADYASYRKLTDEPFLSLDHGNRWVDVYVNEIGADAYEPPAEVPVGTVIVKTSVLDDGNGAPGTVAGPIFVMEKRAAGYAPDDGDWWYAIHWAAPPKDAKMPGPIYWRGKSPRVDYCADCHSSYDRGIGGLIPSSILKR